MGFFSFRKKKTIEAQGSSILSAYKSNAGEGVDDQKRRAFLKKGLWGAVGIGAIAALSKMGSAASGVIFGDNSFQSAAPLTLGTPVATTSGTAITFTGIPAGTKYITVMFAGVSTNGTSAKLIRIGDAGGVETTGYVSSSVETNGGTSTTLGDTSGFVINSVLAADLLNGSITLSLENSAVFTWVGSGALGEASGSIRTIAGRKSLSAELTQISLTTVNGTDAFDLGEVNISYM